MADAITPETRLAVLAVLYQAGLDAGCAAPSAGLTLLLLHGNGRADNDGLADEVAADIEDRIGTAVRLLARLREAAALLDSAVAAAHIDACPECAETQPWPNATCDGFQALTAKWDARDGRAEGGEHG